VSDHLHDIAINRRQLIKTGAAGALTVASANWLAACGSGSSPATTAAVHTKPVYGGTLTAAFLSGGQAETISPALAYAPSDIARVQNLHDSLFRIGPNGYGDEPALAVAAESNADATVWTLHLLDGVTWHDGKPFTADDVVYTIKSWLGKHSFLEPIAAIIFDSNGVRKRDRLTVEVKLTRGVAEFRTITALYNAYVIQDGSRLNSPVGTGPFVYKSASHMSTRWSSTLPTQMTLRVSMQPLAVMPMWSPRCRMSLRKRTGPPAACGSETHRAPASKTLSVAWIRRRSRT